MNNITYLHVICNYRRSHRYFFPSTLSNCKVNIDNAVFKLWASILYSALLKKFQLYFLFDLPYTDPDK